MSNNNNMSEQPKKYEISTIQDIAKATNEENLDGFIEELREALLAYHKLSLGMKISFRFDSLTWIDDGKRDQQINVNVDGKRKPEFQVGSETEFIDTEVVDSQLEERLINLIRDDAFYRSFETSAGYRNALAAQIISILVHEKHGYES